jgi:hypothetical protein
VGAVVGCSSYDYKKGGAKGVTLQVCNMSLIKISDANMGSDVSRDKLKLVTGIIDKDGKFSTDLPQGEVFIAGGWLKGKRYEPAPQQSQGTSETTEAGVCFPGLPCYHDQICNATDPFSLKACIPKTKFLTHGVFDPSYNEENAEDEVVVFDTKTIGRAFDQQRFANLCHSFIQPDGALGAWGKEISSTFKSVSNECFYGEQSIDVSDLCPNFKKFPKAQKDYFWAWTGASMSNAESSCRPNVRVKGTKVKRQQEYAVGLFQLEESMHRRKYRGPECSVQKGQSVYSISFQFRCMASIIKNTRWLQGKKLWGSTDRSDQYWQTLKTENGKITKAISNFPGCR